ncbi:MAG: AAA family ATPase [Clostridia bacterium]|nr:AAA family ATPase [Clostridia bacterium]
MSSVLERPELNKIFLIYGNLDDMFISPDLQKNNFRPFLNEYLRSLGYRRIVYYSGAKNVGKFVLDDESAMLAINKNKQLRQESSAPSSQPAQSSAGRRKRRILNPSAAAAQTQSEVPQEGQTSPAAHGTNLNTQNTQNVPSLLPAENEKGEKPQLIYKQPKITPAEFLDDAKKMMSDGSVKTAIVFTFFQDFVTDGGAPLQQYSELLSHLWDEYGLSSNENICIFLAPQMNSDALSQLLDHLASGNVFRSRFFNANKTVNRSCTLGIGLPNQDEFRYMLEYLRIVGDGGKRLRYKRSELRQIVSSIMFLSREADREENRAGYLSSVYENIVRYMKRQPGEVVEFTEEAVKSIYSRFKANDSSDPMEQLLNTRGWEAVAKRVSEIVEDYKKKKERKLSALKKSGALQPIKKNSCANERIDIPDDSTGFDYPIPNFVLRGNPGVGKTTVARLIGQIFYENGILKRGLTIEATKDDLVDRYVGGTPGRTREKIMEAQESVLFLDDAYSLIDKSEDNNYSKEAIDELVAAMTNTKQYRFCMMMAGYPEPMDELLKMNPGLSSRFGKSNILTIEDYPPDLLRDIFINNCRKEGYSFLGDDEAEDGNEDKLDLDLFFKNLYDSRDRANFGNARDVVAIARDVKMQASLRDDDKRCITLEDFGSYAKYFDRHGVSSIDDIYAELDKYVGLDFVKELFENVRLEILDAKDCKRRGIKPDSYPDHYIFAGNPGTGKTTVGKMMGQFYHLMGVMGGSETIFVDASELIGSHVGDSKNKMVEKIQDAIDHNSLLYIDEAYQITDSAYSAEIVGAMMTRMTENADDFKMIFGMYSNRVEDFLKMNAGLSRRVRIVEFPDYKPDQLVKIFDKTIEQQGRSITDEAHRYIELIMEHKYNTRTEDFGNAGEVKKLVIDMKKLLLRRTSSLEGADKYTYTAEDIPSAEMETIKDQINPRTFEDIMKDLNEQIGLSDLKDVIVRKQEEILYAKKSGGSLYNINPGYYFFVGNPGTGKSTSAKLFAECLYELGIVKSNRFLSCTAKDLIGQYVGETDKKTYALLQKSVNGVLFIDEAYSLSYAGGSGAEVGYKKEALEQIIAFMDVPEHRRKCCLIFAGYEKDMQGLYKSNSGMRSRIEEVHFNDFSAEEMFDIFALFCRKGGFALAEGIREYYVPIFEKMTRMEYYSNGRTARTVYEKTLANFRRRIIHSENLTEEDSKRIIPSDLLTEEECLDIVDR